MGKTNHLRLVVSNTTRNLYERCMLADPLLAIIGTAKLQRLLGGIPGEPPYLNFRDYWRRTSRGGCSGNQTLEELIMSVVKNYFSAQLTKAFVNAPRIWTATHLEIGRSIERSQSPIKATLFEQYSRELAEIILFHHTAPRVDCGTEEIQSLTVFE